MSATEIKQNLGRIIRTLQGQDLKLTHIAKSMGYTTTAQLHSSLEGDSLISTKAVIALIKSFNVNPNYLFLGKGEMFQSDESELEKLQKENRELGKNHNEALKTMLKLKETVNTLEKRNADLIDLTSAAIKYHQANNPDDEKHD